MCLGQLSLSLFLWYTARQGLWDVAAPELPSQKGRTQSRRTRGSTGAPLSGRRSPEPWDTW
jgi:hypothetical protein